jgi:hypothetical protein
MATDIVEFQDGIGGFRLYGARGISSRNAGDSNGDGTIASNAGDFNGDGFDDLIIGESHSFANGPFSGQAVLVFGKASGFSNNAIFSDLEGTDGFVMNVQLFGSEAGKDVSAVGDGGFRREAQRDQANLI